MNYNQYNQNDKIKQFKFQSKNEYLDQSSINNTNSVLSESIPTKHILPTEIIEEKEEEESFSSVIKKNNLVFEEKNISFIKLYCHLSEKLEIFLMILGTIASLGSGVAAPLMCHLFGDMANDFTSINADDSQMEMLKKLIECKNEEEVKN